MSMDEIRARIATALPPDGAELLRTVFSKTESRSTGISAERFRADNYSYIHSIDQLERYFIARAHDNAQQKQVYRLNRIALPIVDNNASRELLLRMDKLLQYAVRQYDKKLSHLMPLKDMLRFLGGRDRNVSLEAVLYLLGSQGFSGGTLNFPVGDDAAVFISERILESRTIEDVLEYDIQWIGAPGPVGATPIAVNNVIESVSSEEGGFRQFSFDALKMHPKIIKVSAKLFGDGHHWEAVFAASKALVSLVKEKSGKMDLDGATLMRTVFSRNNPILAINDLSNPTELDEQEGMMDLFVGAVLGIRNPGGHSFPEGTEQRALEYLTLISLLAHLVDESENISEPPR